ncbi:MAG: nucleotide pyrophosphohydrolase [Tissierellia bacterium]|nr:nucleotide pyrophosphohydrolase [Tissierellia bacterium]
MLTIVGLGPGSRSYLSRDAYDALTSAEKVYLRTSWHPVLEELELEYESFDDAYEQAQDFDTLYRQIAETVYQASLGGDVVFAVPGSPYQAEHTVRHLLEMTDVRVIPGVSFVEPVLQALQYDVTGGLMILDGLSDFRLPEDISGLLLQVYSQAVASQVKLKLMETIPDDRMVVIIKSAGIEDQQELIEVALYELDHQPVFDHLTSLFIPAGQARHRTLEELVDVTARLRAPGGCAWDSQQTHQSLKRYLIEESYEVLEAIDQADYEMMEDELGDLLFQAVFHAQIASETGYFNIYDVIQGITDKLIRRHSHVFQNDIAATPDAVVELWEKNKQSERTLSDRLRAIPRVSPLHYGMKAIKLLGHKPQGGLTRASDEELVEQLMEIVAEATKRDLPLDLLLSEKVSQMVEDVEQG